MQSNQNHNTNQIYSCEKEKYYLFSRQGFGFGLRSEEGKFEVRVLQQRGRGNWACFSVRLETDGGCSEIRAAVDAVAMWLRSGKCGCRAVDSGVSDGVSGGRTTLGGSQVGFRVTAQRVCID
ncbi:hypothetical protein ACLB2K_010937 [Fragaria x ananassa]